MIQQLISKAIKVPIVIFLKVSIYDPKQDAESDEVKPDKPEVDASKPKMDAERPETKSTPLFSFQQYGQATPGPTRTLPSHVWANGVCMNQVPYDKEMKGTAVLFSL